MPLDRPQVGATGLEKNVLGLVSVDMVVIKLRTTKGDRGKGMSAIKGHTICFPHNGARAYAAALPNQNLGGVAGQMSALGGKLEAQNRGTSHAHLLLITDQE